MTNKTILREIYRENKSINRNLQRLANIGLIGCLEKVLRRQRKQMIPLERHLQRLD